MRINRTVPNKSEPSPISPKDYYDWVVRAAGGAYENAKKEAPCYKKKIIMHRK